MFSVFFLLYKQYYQHTCSGFSTKKKWQAVVQTAKPNQIIVLNGECSAIDQTLRLALDFMIFSSQWRAKLPTSATRVRSNHVTGLGQTRPPSQKPRWPPWATSTQRVLEVSTIKKYLVYASMRIKLLKGLIRLYKKTVNKDF